ncbi:SRPBCC family protein [Dietzia sp.]|uniref:SRPBCC family protein n=1 Tax=Dietzia sp. TaxID=1871616 RepID=UPI002FDA533E
MDQPAAGPIADVATRIDTAGGRWLEAETIVSVPSERAFREIATGKGISSWFCAAAVEPEVGGALTLYLDPVSEPGTAAAEESASRGEITEYRAPSAFGPGRFAYVERDWMGPGLPVDPWITEFEVSEAAAGSPAGATRISLRSGFDKDSHLAGESIAPSIEGWAQSLTALAHRLDTFPDGDVRIVAAAAEPAARSVTDRWAAALSALGISASAAPGDSFSTAGRVGRVAGTVLRIADGSGVFALAAPHTGTLSLQCYPAGESAEQATTHSALGARVASPDLAAAEAWDEQRWSRWVESLG